MSFLRYDYCMQNETAPEGIQNFKRALENAFEQFKKIWNDNSELVVKYKESEANLLDARSKLQEVAQDRNNSRPKCRSDKENQEPCNEIILVSSNSDKVPSVTKDTEIDDDEKSKASIHPVLDNTIPELFSHDFDSQELERNFLERSGTPTREVESPPLVQSPIFRGRYLKSRKFNSSTSSGSPLSVKTLNNSVEENSPKYAGNVSSYSSRPALTTTILADIDKSNSFDFSLQKAQSDSRLNPKVFKKLGISTTHNVQTEIVFGKKSKLKQSKLKLQEPGKVTDVSFCEDVYNRVPIDREPQSTCTTLLSESQRVPKDRRDKEKTQDPKVLTSTSTASSFGKRLVKNVDSRKKNKSVCPEDEVIEASPMQEECFSKIRNKLSCKSKSSEAESSKIVVDEFDEIPTVDDDVLEIVNASVCDIEMDTDMTLFLPKAKSTQYELVTQNFAMPVKSACFQNKQNSKGKSAFKKVNTTSLHVDKNNSQSHIQKTHSSRCEYLVSSKVNLAAPNSRSPAKKSRLSLKKNVTQACGSADECSGSINANCTYGDETFFLPAELSEVWSNDKIDEEKADSDVDTSADTHKHDSPPRKRALLDSFDIVPRREPPSPKYAYKGSPVRKKAERAKLNGWDCWDCKKYYEAMGLSPEELQSRKNLCSRHRAKHNEKANTPEDYWNPDFPDTMHTIYCNE